MEIGLERAGPERRETLENLFQLYVHDFSEQWAVQGRGALGEDGRFEAYPHLDSYWTEPGRDAWLIRANGELAGFALVNGIAHSGLPVDFSVAEFFVARKHRRAGVGFAAATQLIGARPGQWEAAVARANVGALPFWRRVAEAIAPGRVEVVARDDAAWNGPILRFANIIPKG
jgi:predicted acetyltransferase